MGGTAFSSPSLVRVSGWVGGWGERVSRRLGQQKVRRKVKISKVQRLEKKKESKKTKATEC